MSPKKSVGSVTTVAPTSGATGVALDARVTAGFSVPLESTGWNHRRIAHAWAELMARLGYERYGAQGGDTGSVVSPLLGHVDDMTELYANAGYGYHSNDARVAVVPGSSPLARAKSYEVGLRSKPWGVDGVELIATLWQLDLKSELVFVGDEGTTEIRGPSRRRGLEVAARGQIFGPLYFNGSVTYTKAEFRNGDAIPLAPEVTAYGAVLLHWPEGLRSQLQATYLGVRPLIEDRSVKAPSWVDVDLSERYRLPVKLPYGRLEAFLFIQNLLNTKWEQATFYFTSRLRNEPAEGVPDIHFVPGNPRYFLGGLAWYF